MIVHYLGRWSRRCAAAVLTGRRGWHVQITSRSTRTHRHPHRGDFCVLCVLGARVHCGRRWVVKLNHYAWAGGGQADLPAHQLQFSAHTHALAFGPKTPSKSTASNQYIGTHTSWCSCPSACVRMKWTYRPRPRQRVHMYISWPNWAHISCRTVCVCVYTSFPSAQLISNQLRLFQFVVCGCVDVTHYIHSVHPTFPSMAAIEQRAAQAHPPPPKGVLSFRGLVALLANRMWSAICQWNHLWAHARAFL